MLISPDKCGKTQYRQTNPNHPTWKNWNGSTWLGYISLAETARLWNRTPEQIADENGY